MILHDFFFFLPAYGATLIEHCLIEAGFSGAVKIDQHLENKGGIF